ncbi:uncharacterized protein BDR25DRAFT_344689 [Lindgomyces ingoldianus]|uniref:Uncharacterized protein n=1 Tax=Lindgomyces ingoldianus TaxID=673940 RepID=A0ACB6QNW7_9PLEO|nr:uncharacterized protein BDR25DRAFT_344689 [Lindgomyces ingoldianus]KAF2467982.1 hypothetical protein BDR25DRAFT_344689 [Lindgomyces ingoldianus]
MVLRLASRFDGLPLFMKNLHFNQPAWVEIYYKAISVYNIPQSIVEEEMIKFQCRTAKNPKEFGQDEFIASYLGEVLKEVTLKTRKERLDSMQRAWASWLVERLDKRFVDRFVLVFGAARKESPITLCSSHKKEDPKKGKFSKRLDNLFRLNPGVKRPAEDPNDILFEKLRQEVKRERIEKQRRIPDRPRPGEVPRFYPIGPPHRPGPDSVPPPISSEGDLTGDSHRAPPPSLDEFYDFQELSPLRASAPPRSFPPPLRVVSSPLPPEPNHIDENLPGATYPRPLCLEVDDFNKYVQPETSTPPPWGGYQPLRVVLPPTAPERYHLDDSFLCPHDLSSLLPEVDVFNRVFSSTIPVSPPSAGYQRNQNMPSKCPPDDVWLDLDSFEIQLQWVQRDGAAFLSSTMRNFFGRNTELQISANLSARSRGRI